jgi:hypothetical protein
MMLEGMMLEGMRLQVGLNADGSVPEGNEGRLRPVQPNQ